MNKRQIDLLNSRLNSKQIMSKVALKFTLALILILNLVSLSFAQDPPSQNSNVSVSSSVSSSTPTAATKGVNPTIGSYGGSNFDKVNLFNGNVSMSFPLASLTSRGGMSAGVVLSYNAKLWHVEKHEEDRSSKIFAEPPTIAISYYPVYDEYDYGLPELAAGWTIHAGRMTGRQVVFGYGKSTTCFFDDPTGHRPVAKPTTTLTTFVFTAPDGTEYDFRDTIYDGQPQGLVNCEGVSRGNTFISKDGTSATFVSDTNITDTTDNNQITNINGYIYLRDGTRFRIEQGKPVQQRDHNGNIVRYQYNLLGQLILVTDNMGRTITVAYNTDSATLATITIKGFNGSARVTKVKSSNLDQRLLNATSVATIGQLFPVQSADIGNADGVFNPQIISEITLPDQHKWSFKYNTYGEVVQVITPARGVVEYSMGTAATEAATGGYIEQKNEIFRRVIDRKTYPSSQESVNGIVPGPIEGKVTYSDPMDPARLDNGNLVVTEKEVDPNNSDSTVTESRHKFSGSPNTGIKGTGVPLNTGYRPWLEGKEIETKIINPATGNPMRTITNQYKLRAGVNWVKDNNNQPAGADFLSQPENDPRLVNVTTTLQDSSQSSTTKTSVVDYQYDDFNNVTSEQLTGYNNEIIRRVERTYVTNLNGYNYTGLNRDKAPANNPNLYDIHMRSLIASETIKSVSGQTQTVEAQTLYEYDIYGGNLHAALVPRTLTFDSQATNYISPDRILRGNVTAITRGLDGNQNPDQTTTYPQYDVLGNVVAVVGPLSNQKTTTTYNLTSQFTFPEVINQYVNNSLTGDRILSSTKVYDFDTGLVKSSIGLNGEVTTFQYDDMLDRLTAEIRPQSSGISLYSNGFGTTTYSYSAPGVYPNSVTVKTTLDNSANGRFLQSQSFFDGFLRTTEQHRTDPDGEVISQTTYDATGRVSSVTNPFRNNDPNDTNGYTKGYTTTTYDPLDRVQTVETFDKDGHSTGKVITEYNNNLVTVTDQADKKRMSETDAAGRLINVYEPSSSANVLDQVTSYTYDARSNLKKVVQGTELLQGPQQRLFTYDALSRLTSASSPETGDSSGNGITTYEYDQASNLIHRTDPRGIITTYSYDSLNRLKEKFYSPTPDGYQTPKVQYFYDAVPSSLPPGVTAPTGFTFQYPLGRATAIASFATNRDAASALFHTYDIGGRIAQSSQFLDGQNYVTKSAYNEASLPTSHTYPSGRITNHTYNIAGQITSINSNLAGNQVVSSDTNAYMASGALASQHLGNGLYHQMAYNSRLQPTSISLGTDTSSNSASHWKLDYNYGSYASSDLASTTTPSFSTVTNKNNGNIGSIRLTPGSGSSPIDQFFVYDELNRLKLAKEFATPTTTATTCTIRIPDVFVTGDANVGNAGAFVQTLYLNASENASGTVSVPIDLTSPDLVGRKVRLTIGGSLGGETSVAQAGYTRSELSGSVNASINGVGVISLSGSSVGNSLAYAFSQTTYFDATPYIGQVITLSAQIQAQVTKDSNGFFSGVSDASVAITAAECDPPPPDFTLSASPDHITVSPGHAVSLNSNISVASLEGFNQTVDLTIDSVASGLSAALDSNSITPSSGTVLHITGPAGLANGTYVVTLTGKSTVDGQLVSHSINLSIKIGSSGGGGSIAPEKKSDCPTCPRRFLALSAPISSWSQEYTYDRFGNRSAVIGTNSQNLMIDLKKNRIIDNGYQYDLSGNLIADSSGKFYHYDAENKLVMVASDAAFTSILAQYFYDGNGWRIKKVAADTTRFIYDQGGRLLEELDGEPVPAQNTPTREHIYGASGMLATVEPDKINYHTPDHLGSPRVLTDATGAVISRRDNLPFGEQLDATFGGRANVTGYSPSNDNVKQHFTGYFNDQETGLDFAQARYFNSGLGRFMSRDTFRGEEHLENPQKWNQYAYVINNPLRYSDPDGRDPQDPTAIVTAPAPPTAPNPTPAEVDQVLARMEALSTEGSLAGPIAIVGAALIVGTAIVTDPGPANDQYRIQAQIQPNKTAQDQIKAAQEKQKQQWQQQQPSNQPPPAPELKGKGSTKNERKINPKRKEAAEKKLKEAKDAYDALYSKPNKTKEDNEELERLQRAVNKAKDDLKKSEPHANTTTRH